MRRVASCPPLAVSRLVELAGPPGAGKSTILRILRERARNVEVPPVLLTREYAPLLMTNLPPVLATLVRGRATRQLSVEKVRAMLYLRAVPQLIERRPLAGGKVLVFDQGPLYLLGEAQLQDDGLAAWRKVTLEKWGSLLDTVVRLDAPDAVLAERIDARSKWHRVQGKGLEAAADVLARARNAYEDLLASLDARGGGPAVLRFDTSDVSPEEVVDVVLKRIDGFETGVHPDPPPEHVSLRG